MPEAHSTLVPAMHCADNEQQATITKHCYVHYFPLITESAVHGSVVRDLYINGGVNLVASLLQTTLRIKNSTTKTKCACVVQNLHRLSILQLKII